jgi:type IV pilus assembly protein PilX
MKPIFSSGRRGRPAQQRGAVLFIALVFLILLSLLAVFASNTSIMQERMTGGMRNSQLAQMGADSAVRGTEFMIWSAPSQRRNLPCTRNGGSTVFRCYSRDGTFVDAKVDAFRAVKGVIPTGSDGAMVAPISNMTTAPDTAKLADRPRVMVELLGPLATDLVHSGAKPLASGPGGGVQEFLAYRITGRSTGGTAATVRSAESIFVAQTQPISTAP